MEQVKQAYQTPELQEWGAVETLTQEAFKEIICSSVYDECVR